MRTLAQLMQYSFETYRERTALSTSSRKWSYTELAAYKERCLVRFDQFGLYPGANLGLLLTKSLEFAGLISAAICFNLPYVPLATDNPTERIAYMVNDAACDAIITTAAYADLLQPHLPKYHFKPFLDDLLIGQPAARTSKEYPQDLAYILYTSGSTGQPKGVMITHANAICFIDWAAKQFSLTAEDKIASLAPFHFDLSVFDLFVSFKTGAQLCLFTATEARNPRLLAQQLDAQSISVLYTTPSLLQLLNRYGKLVAYSYNALRLVLFAGEVFPITSLREIKEHWQNAEFYNLYGPTETNVVSWHPIPQVVPSNVQSPYPIGKMCPYAQGKLRNENQYLDCLAGNVGELMIAGTSVSPGYVAKAQKYTGHLLEINGEYWYPTGDWVSINDKDEIVYLGRQDRMVKRRGYRIELAEIESAILQHEQIRGAAAVTVNTTGTPQIFLWLVTANGLPLPHTELKEYLAAHLPLYMSPDRFLFSDNIPLTHRQKVDLQLLKKWAEDGV